MFSSLDRQMLIVCTIQGFIRICRLTGSVHDRKIKKTWKCSCPFLIAILPTAISFCRFSRNQKLDTRVEFPSSFNLRPFMTDNKGPPILYRLYGTVNHEGYSCRSGHYIAFTRRHGLWLSHNDCFVSLF